MVLVNYTCKQTHFLTSLDLLLDYELEASLDGDLLSLNEIQDAPSGLEWLLQELISLRLVLSQEDSDSSGQSDWLALCSRLDCFLFRLYLFILALYASTLVMFWASWSFAWHLDYSVYHIYGHSRCCIVLGVRIEGLKCVSLSTCLLTFTITDITWRQPNPNRVQHTHFSENTGQCLLSQHLKN